MPSNFAMLSRAARHRLARGIVQGCTAARKHRVKPSAGPHLRILNILIACAEGPFGPVAPPLSVAPPDKPLSCYIERTKRAWVEITSRGLRPAPRRVALGARRAGSTVLPTTVIAHGRRLPQILCIHDDQCDVRNAAASGGSLIISPLPVRRAWRWKPAATPRDVFHAGDVA